MRALFIKGEIANEYFLKFAQAGRERSLMRKEFFEAISQLALMWNQNRIEELFVEIDDFENGRRQE